MKVIDRIAFILFSSIMLIIAIVLSFLVFGWISLGAIDTVLEGILTNITASNILLGGNVVVMLLAVKGIFFESGSNGIDNSGILLQNENGKLLISKETIENLVNGVAKGFDSTQNVTTRIQVEKDNSVNVYVTLFVHSDVVIKELSANLQTRVKEVVKKATDLEIKEVNIRVKNIAQKQAISE